MTTIYLQARLLSLRLPHKVLLPLAGKTVLEHAMRALDKVPADKRSVLSTSDSAAALEKIVQARGWDLFIGPEDDVLARYILAARQDGSDRILRATADNPLLSSCMARKTLELAEESGAAYTGFQKLPLGAGVEVLDVARLEEAHSEACEQGEREHVSPFLYRRPQRYLLARPDAPANYQGPQFRITLDTREDYHSLQRIYADLYQGEPIDLDILIPYLKSRETSLD